MEHLTESVGCRQVVKLDLSLHSLYFYVVKVKVLYHTVYCAVCDICHSQRFLRKTYTIARDDNKTSSSTIEKACALPARGRSTFIPYRPEKTVGIMRKIEIDVSRLNVRFSSFAANASYASRILTMVFSRDFTSSISSAVPSERS
jgi:hypothetical protein